MANTTRERIELVYRKLIAENEEVKEDLNRQFKEVRILVVGKSGCGKSTLIRLMIGEKGPRSITFGNVGEQDINREWRHPTAPLIIHDSNGIDTSGRNRLLKIKHFLQIHTSCEEENKRVHAVWYVFSAVENRAGDDDGLLKTVDSFGKKLPLLIVMTHKDLIKSAAKQEKAEEVVLRMISDAERRKQLKAKMIRLGNDVEFDERTGELLGGMKGDVVEGLKLVYERTKELTGKRWLTWTATQSVDMKAKVEASAKLILSKRGYQAFRNCIPTFSRKDQFGRMFGRLTKGLAIIWDASPNLQMALLSCKYLEDQGWNVAEEVLGTSIAATLPIVVGAVAATVDAGVFSGPLLTWAAGTRIEELWSMPKVIITYALIVVGAILYIRIRRPARECSVDEYLQLCKEFVGRPEAAQISQISERYDPKFGNWLRSKSKKQEERDRLTSEIVGFFECLSPMPM